LLGPFEETFLRQPRSSAPDTADPDAAQRDSR
jgi:hypothetical protein